MLQDRQIIEVRHNGRKRVQTVNEMESKTQQSDVHQAEIKNILARYEQTGVIEHMQAVDLQFRDISEFTDYAQLRQQQAEAQSVFNALPSKLREVFGHDYFNWLDAAHDPEKLEALRPQLEKLGVLEPTEVIQAVEELPAPPAAEPPPTSA